MEANKLLGVLYKCVSEHTIKICKLLFLKKFNSYKSFVFLPAKFNLIKSIKQKKIHKI